MCRHTADVVLDGSGVPGRVLRPRLCRTKGGSQRGGGVGFSEKAIHSVATTSFPPPSWRFLRDIKANSRLMPSTSASDCPMLTCLVRTKISGACMRSVLAVSPARARGRVFLRHI